MLCSLAIIILPVPTIVVHPFNVVACEKVTLISMRKSFNFFFISVMQLENATVENKKSEMKVVVQFGRPYRTATVQCVDNYAWSRF